MSCSASLRLAVVVLMCIAGLSAAQSFTECPNVTSTNAFFAASNCSAYLTCAAARCTCVGGTYSTTSLTCTVSTAGKTCTTSQPCQTTFVQCMQTAASTSSCLTSLKIALMNVVAGTSYNNSVVYQACSADTCEFFNHTSASNCTIPYSSVCYLGATTPTPATTNASTSAPSNNTNTSAPGTTVGLFVGTMTLAGTYTTFYNNATAMAIFYASCGLDLTNKLTVPCQCVSSVLGSLIVTFTAQTAANNATFLSAVAAAAANGNWLVNTKAAFTALGGTGTFGLTGISAPGVTPAPATPTPGGSGSALLMAWTALLIAVIAVFM